MNSSAPSEKSHGNSLGAASGYLLAGLPGPDDNPILVSDAAGQLLQSGVVSTRAAARAAVNMLFAPLEQLGLLHRPQPNLVQAVSDDAATLLHSLGEYLKADLPLMGDWRARGAMADAKRHRNLIGLVEEYRIERQGENAPPARRIEAVAALIKGQLGTRQVYLLQENPNWKLDWWIGGIVERADICPERALAREIEEELEVPPHAIKEMQTFAEITYSRVSARLHAKTEYHTRFFEVALDERVISAERFKERNDLTTIDRNGRQFFRKNRWLTWEQFCAQPGFDSKASDIAAMLVKRGIAGLAAPHSIAICESAGEGIAEGSSSERSNQVAATAQRMDRIVLSECAVVGKYLKFDSVVRNSLKDWSRRIMAPLCSKSNQEVNFLIWAASGSGKSYFVQQIAEKLNEELGGNFTYVECNLAKDTREEFISKVNSVASRSQPVLCLLDEIDTRAEEKWPYEVCFGQLELNTKPDRQVVFVLIGSSEDSLPGMIKVMEKRHKGPDLLNRILRDHNCFIIPPANLEDVSAMVLGQIRNLIGDRVRAVEKLALYYILSNEVLRSSPKQLREFIKSAATRFQASDDRLRFYHLFRAEDEEKKYAFRRANEGLIDQLIERDIQIAP